MSDPKEASDNLIDELMTMFADVYVDKLTYRAAKEIVRLEEALASITRERDDAAARAERLSLTLGVYKTADGLRKCLEANSYPDPALVEKVDACLAVLGHAPLSAALVNGEGG